MNISHLTTTRGM